MDHLLATLAAVFIIGNGEGFACQCMDSGPPCQAYFQSDAVFAGTVREITENPEAGFDARVRVEFEQAVPSRGVQGSSVTVFTSVADGASCGYPFKRGERYVVYAYRSKDGAAMRTSICSRTRLVKDAGDDVRFFGTLSAPATAARVFGTGTHVERDLLTGESHNQGPAAGITLTLRGDGRSFEARTGPDGRYEIGGVPPGTYELTAVTPQTFAIRFQRSTIQLKEARACHASDFFIRFAEDVTTGPDGGFSFPVQEGVIYRVNAWYGEPENPGRAHSVGFVQFVASEENAKTLRMTLSPVRR